MSQQQQQTPYIGSKISLISKLDIRYEGTLYSVDSNDSTIALSKVRSFGTEDRPTLHSVPGRDEVYEYIIFKATDIKDLVVCETPKPQSSGGLPYDPAIVSVSQKAQVPPSNSRPEDKVFRPITPPQQAPPLHKPRPLAAGRSRDGHNASNDMAFGAPANSSRMIPSLATSQFNYRAPRQYAADQMDSNWGRGRGNAHYQQSRPSYQQGQYKSDADHPGGYRQGWNKPAHQREQQQAKMQGDYDFEKANEKFEEKLHHVNAELDKINLQEGEKEGSEDEAAQEGDSDHENNAGNGNFYDKKSSFFDKISCEALEKEEGRNNRPNWRKERVTNEETFGQSFVRTTNWQRRGYGRPAYQQRPNRYNYRGDGYSFGRTGGSYRGSSNPRHSTGIPAAP